MNAQIIFGYRANKYSLEDRLRKLLKGGKKHTRKRWAKKSGKSGKSRKRKSTKQSS